MPRMMQMTILLELIPFGNYTMIKGLNNNKKPKRLENSQLSKAANEGVLRNRCSRGVLSLEN